MTRQIRTSAILGAAALLGAIVSSAPRADAQVVVYCTGPGVPVGCVVRPAPAVRVVYCTRPLYPVGCVARPAPAAAAIYCTRPGYPVGCIDRGAPGVGIAPGVPGNRGGPVNRVGRF